MSALREKFSKAMAGTDQSSLTTLLRFLSHELRNPLMALLTAVDNMGGDLTPSELASTRRVARRQSARLAEILEELLDASNASTEKGERLDLPSPASPAKRAQGKLLLVEDQEDNREMLAMVLTRADHEVVAVGDVKAAVEALSTETFTAAVIDIGLPDGSGLEVARAAREKCGDEILLVALTGHGRDADKSAIVEAGFDLHLVKPISSVDLRNALSPQSADEDSQEAGPIRVIAVGPEILVASGIECFVANRDAFELVTTAEDRETTLSVLEDNPTDILLLYVSLPDGLGPDLVKLASIRPNLHIAVVVEAGENALARECMLAGADCCIATDSPPEDLIKALQVAHDSGTFVADEVDATVARDVVFTALTRREREVLRLVANGLTSREIAAELDVAYKTVDAHRQNIVRKLASSSVSDLVKHAIRSGLTDLSIEPRA